MLPRKGLSENLHVTPIHVDPGPQSALVKCFLTIPLELSEMDSYFLVLARECPP
jgi:hypothetical protein